MKILYISAIIPSETGAGCNIDLSILRRLSQDHDIDAVIIKSDKDTNKIPGIFNELFCVEINNLKRIIRSILFFFLPGMFVYRIDRKIIKKLYSMRKNNYDIVFFSMSQVALYILFIKYIMKNTRTILLIHDVLRQTFFRKYSNERNILKKIFFFLEHKKLCIIEKPVYSIPDCLIVLNEKDRILLNGTKAAIEVIVPIYKKYYFVDKNLKNDKFYLCYFGSFARFENIDAVKHYLNTLHKMLTQKISNYKYLIVGLDAEKHFFNDEYVEVYGFQEDPSKLLNLCKAAVIPLRYGAGIKIKILELLCLGLPCFCTSVASEGISTMDSLITNDNLTELGNSIIEFYQNNKFDRKKNRESFLRLYDLESNNTKIDTIFSFNKGE